MKIATLTLAIGMLVCALPAQIASAQDWPQRPIRLMVGFGAGGGTDIAARVVAEPLGELLGQRFVIENKPGAGGTIAGDMVAKGPKDGYTALMISAGHTVSAVMIKSQGYDAIKDFAPVGIVGHSAFSVITYKDFPANDLKGLIEIAKKDPGKLNYGSVGIGSTQHLTAELLRIRAGIPAQGVPFRTTPEMLTALIRKDIAYAIDPAHTVRGQVASGELKYLAVANGKRWPPLPNVPTVIESGVPNFDVLGWYGLVFPAGVPDAIVQKASKALNEVLARDSVKKQLDNVGAMAVSSTPAEFGKMIAEEVARWREVATSAGLQPQ